MKRVGHLLVAAALWWSAPSPSGAAPAPAKQTKTYLVGAEIHVGNGTVIKDGVVEIEADRIRAVGGPELKGRIPSGAKTQDVSGKIITPGLIVADTPLGLVEIGLEGSTRDDQDSAGGEVRAGYDPAPAVNADSSLLRIQLVEGVTTAAVSPSGSALLVGQVTWLDNLPGRHGGMVSKSKIAVDGNLGHSHGGSRAASISHLRKVLADAKFYRRNRAGFDRGQSRPLIAHPLDLEGMFDVLDGRAPLTITAHRASDILSLLDVAEEFRIELVIVGGTEAWKVRRQLAEAKVPVILQPTSNLPGSFDRLGARLDNAALLVKAGVEIVIADFGDPHNVRNVTQEAGNAVAHGLDWEEALSAVTRNVAEVYGMSKEYGTVEKGKVASLVVWDADPFELSNWPTQVYVRGERMPLHSRQTKLRDRYRDLSEYTP